jgi:hypothetical protein
MAPTGECAVVGRQFWQGARARAATRWRSLRAVMARAEFAPASAWLAQPRLRHRWSHAGVRPMFRSLLVDRLCRHEPLDPLCEHRCSKLTVGRSCGGRFRGPSERFKFARLHSLAPTYRATNRQAIILTKVVRAALNLAAFPGSGTAPQAMTCLQRAPAIRRAGHIARAPGCARRVLQPRTPMWSRSQVAAHQGSLDRCGKGACPGNFTNGSH